MGPIDVFISYAEEDKPLLGELLNHLGILKRLQAPDLAASDRPPSRTASCAGIAVSGLVAVLLCRWLTANWCLRGHAAWGHTGTTPARHSVAGMARAYRLFCGMGSVGQVCPFRAGNRHVAGRVSGRCWTAAVRSHGGVACGHLPELWVSPQPVPLGG